MPQLSAAASFDKMTAGEVLRKYGWSEDYPKGGMRLLWKQYWDQEVEPLHEECLPEWRAALDTIGEERVPELMELAERFGIISEDDPRLPDIRYYEASSARRLAPTKGRVIELDQYPYLHDEIRLLRDDEHSGVVQYGHQTGKTYFMWYFLMHILMRAEPVVLSLGANEHYLFLSDDVWKLQKPMLNPDSSSRHDFLQVVPEGTWALVDCDPLSSPPTMAFSSDLLFFPVYFAPPHMGKYDLLLAVPHPPALRVIEPMTSREIVACCSLYRPKWARDNPLLALRRLLDYIGVFGHAPESCFDSALKGVSVDDASDQALHCIAQFDLARLRHILVSLNRIDGGLPYTSIDVEWSLCLKKVFIIQRVVGWPSDNITLSFASPWMMYRMFQEFTVQQRDYTRTLISLLLKDHRKLGTATGVMFETMMHHVLAAAPSDNAGRFELREFDLGASTQRAKFNPHEITIEHIVRKRAVQWYFTRCPPKFDTRLFLVPDAANNPTFDAVLYDYLEPDVKAALSDTEVRGRSLPRRRAQTVTGEQRFPNTSSSRPASGEYALSRNRAGKDFDFEAAVGYRPGGRSASASTWASSFAQPMGPSPTPFSSHSRSSSRMSSAHPHSRARTWAPDETSPGALLKRKRSALDGPPSSKTGNKVPKEWDETKHCIALQMTIADEHDVATDGLDRLMSSFEPRRGSWSFVFVTPKSRPMNVKRQVAILMNLDEDWRNRFRWYNLIVDFAHPGYLDMDLEDDSNVPTRDGQVPAEQRGVATGQDGEVKEGQGEEGQDEVKVVDGEEGISMRAAGTDTEGAQRGGD
ncbi:hypothetical protein PENSPDRAFT_738462 [Peniophora sp. CONT]|nr:hypothetical protein PENSPDRAFT_738462 [Peniophora sp. CONT]